MSSEIGFTGTKSEIDKLHKELADWKNLTWTDRYGNELSFEDMTSSELFYLVRRLWNKLSSVKLGPDHSTDLNHSRVYLFTRFVAGYRHCIQRPLKETWRDDLQFMAITLHKNPDCL